MFKDEFVKENRNAIAKFITAYNKSVKKINTNPGQYKDLMTSRLRLPADIKDTFRVPAFNEAVLPAEKDVMLVYRWMKKNGMITQPVDYKNLIVQIEKK